MDQRVKETLKKFDDCERAMRESQRLPKHEETERALTAFGAIHFRLGDETTSYAIELRSFLGSLTLGEVENRLAELTHGEEVLREWQSVSSFLVQRRASKDNSPEEAS